MKYKVLPSAAHNFGHSFMSAMNYVGDDYVMSHIAWAVEESGADRLEIDLLTGDARPKDLTPPPVLDAVVRYREWFPTHLERHGVDPEAVVEAKMSFTFHPDERKELGSGPFDNAWEMPVDCVVIIRDDQGKEHRGILRDRCIAEARSRKQRWFDPRHWFRRA